MAETTLTLSAAPLRSREEGDYTKEEDEGFGVNGPGTMTRANKQKHFGNSLQNLNFPSLSLGRRLSFFFSPELSRCLEAALHSHDQIDEESLRNASRHAVPHQRDIIVYTKWTLEYLVNACHYHKRLAMLVVGLWVSMNGARLRSVLECAISRDHFLLVNNLDQKINKQ